ncbi:MAG TPA: ABC transporter ATP-binding protein [Bacilli bacterium]|nr:ABC transporter ATP-binding protein [Bacilli bacterium]
MIIEVTGLVKKYKDHVAVNGVDLQIEEGEIFGLLGPNGAGKSTTMNTLLGLLKVNGGTVKMFGKDFSKHAREIKSSVGYVPQDFAFFETLSAIDNVMYWGKLYGLRDKELEKAVKDALEFTGLWDRRKSKASTFSGGMKRRLNIACAIVHQPRILFMDEPTVGVDPQSRNNILESIKTMNQNGMTIIYTTHYMEEIEAICERVAIMDFGKVIALGSIDELVESISTGNRLTMELIANTEAAVPVIEKTEGVVSCTNMDGELHIQLGNDEKYLMTLIEALMQNGFGIKTMTLDKPNLETVFLQLTGKKLRD